MSELLQVVCPFCDAINRVSSDRLADQAVCCQCKQPLCTGVPLELTADNFERHVNDSDVPILVDFWAPWCGPCRMMAPVIDVAAKTLEATMRVAKLNTETEGQIAARFAIRNIPTLAIFRRGRVISQRSGAIDLVRLLEWARPLASTAERGSS